MLVFETPFFLSFFIILPILVFLRRYLLKQGGRLTLALGTWNGPAHPSAPYHIRGIKAVSDVLEAISFIMLILALSGPGYSVREDVYLENGGSIMFVLDESPSMAAQDFPPGTRFDAARGVIERFVKAQTNTSVGLVSFAQNAALRVVSTLDYPFFTEKLWDLKLADLGIGTAIGMGIALGSLHLEDFGGSKVMVLFTDGQSNAGEIQPETAALALKSLGIRLYVIGVGSKERVATQLINPETGLPITGTLEGAFSEDELRKIAALAGGTYFSAYNSTSLEGVIRSIESREVMESRSTTRVNFISYQKHVSVFLLVFFLLSLFIRKVILKEVL